ncbi:MAG: saccharopine dehydrogenase NADP-binding domain-containing protein [Elusimicrobia bacterium]|nr:saccharopine dehydrogenase NADP-binding domain-containing protein [Elusimicrobiota bacterium]
MKIAVLGAFGLMGEACLCDLAQSPSVTEVLAVDLNIKRQKQVLAKIKQRQKVKVLSLNFMQDRKKALAALQGVRALVNCAWYELNLEAMDFAAALGAHYVDLGGLYHMTLKQLKKNSEFAKRGLYAIVGCGSTPGITNMMVQSLAQEFSRVETVKILDAAYEPGNTAPGFLPPFSIRTMLDETEKKAAVFEDGKMRFVEPFSAAEEIEFKPPIGTGTAVAILHSELATLPDALKSKGLKNMYFKLVYAPKIKEQLELLVQLGFSSQNPVRINGHELTPRNFITALAQQNAAGLPPETSSKDVEALRVDMTGEIGGKRAERRMDCTMHPTRTQSAGAIGVGFTASIMAQMVLEGKVLSPPGVYAPEAAFKADVFFQDLLKRKVFALESSSHPHRKAAS